MKHVSVASTGSVASPRSGRSAGELPDGEALIARTLAAITPTYNNRAKASKFLAFCQELTLRKVFYLIGYSIASYPFAYLIAAAIIASLSGGMYFLKLEDQVRDGYTPATSPSRYETDVLREFLQSVGDPTMTTVALRASDRGSMHRVGHLAEAVRLHRFLVHNFTVSVPSSTLQHISYSNVCGAYCNANIVIEYFHDALLSELEREKSGKPRTRLTDLSFPIARIEGFDVHLERNFYGVRVRHSDDAQYFVNISQAPTSATDIDFVQVILMLFRGDISSRETQAILNAWEVAVYEFSLNNYSNTDIEMLVLGAEAVNYVLINDTQKLSPFFAAGFLAMFAFVAVTVMGSAMMSDSMDSGKVLLAVAASLCPILAVTVTFGVCALATLRTNSLMLIMPFLIMGLGVNDAFLMIHSWQRHCSGRFINERLGLVFEEVGPSVTITTLTNVITFSIGALTPTPEISLFCMGNAIALGFAYIFTLILFGPILYYASNFEKTKKKRKHNLKVTAILRSLLVRYCRLITASYFRVLLFAGSFAYWYFAVMGALSIDTRLDVEKLLPRDSPLQESNNVISNLVWAEYYPLTILINSPLDIRKKSVMERFNEMVNDFESVERCKGREFTLLWLRDYMDYWQEATTYNFDFYEDETAKDGTKHNSLSDSETSVDFSRVEEFLQSPLHMHWASFIRRRNSTEMPVEKFWFVVAYQNCTSWTERIDLMKIWRNIAASYTDLNVTVWETNSMFIDQMLSMKPLTVQTGFWTLVCMAAVCALFIHNPFSVVVASLAIASISIGVVGFLSWWHLDLDPAALSAILMSIGMSVDFTAHVSYHFQLRKRKEIRNNRVVKTAIKGTQEKLEYALESVAWPMLQAGLSTVTCVLPLVFLQNHVPLVFVKTICLVVLWGLFHGMMLLPALMSAVPQRLMEVNCYRALLTDNRGRQSEAEPAEEENEADDNVGLQLREPASFLHPARNPLSDTQSHD